MKFSTKHACDFKVIGMYTTHAFDSCSKLKVLSELGRELGKCSLKSLFDLKLYSLK